MKFSVIVILVIVLMLFSLYAFSQEQRIIPVSFRSCEPAAGPDFGPQKLWDGREDTINKWCCFHKGYQVPQKHWVIMDLGQKCNISGIKVVHDGDTGDERHMLTEDYSLFYSSGDGNGPWKMLKVIKDNQLPVNILEFDKVKTQYVGLEVTDTQLSSGPDKPNEDWALRIQELYIFGEQLEYSPGNSDAPTPRTVQRAPGGPFSAASREITTPKEPFSHAVGMTRPDAPFNSVKANQSEKKNTLLYFHKPSNDRCREAQKAFDNPDVRKILEDFKTESILITSGDPRISEIGIFRVPAVVIVDPAGNVKKRSYKIMSAREMAQFLSK